MTEATGSGALQPMPDPYRAGFAGLPYDRQPVTVTGCHIVITDDGPGVVMALCRHHGMIVRDSALSWGYLLAMVNAHKEAASDPSPTSAHSDGGVS